jgi:hypothetical protein
MMAKKELFLVIILLLTLNAHAAVSLPDFFNKINLSYPGLEKVKQEVNSGNYTGARKEFVIYMKHRTTPKYFFDLHERSTIINRIYSEYPGSNTTAIISASNSLSHNFSFSGESRFLGRNINWRQGDTGWTASLNQCTWLISLGRAYWYTNNETYAREYVSLVTDWIGDNPRPAPTDSEGEPWRTLEAGPRAENWFGTYNYMINSPTLNEDFHISLLNSLWNHADYLYDRQYTGNPPPAPNWQMVETSSLSLLGMALPEFKDSGNWRSTGLYYLKYHLDNNVYSDGAFTELAPSYHNWVTSQMLKVIRLAQLNNYSTGLDLDKYKKMYTWVMNTQMPSGETPPFADSSPGTIKTLMTQGALLFNDPYMKYFGSENVPESVYWVFGADSLTEYSRIAGREPAYGSLKTGPSQLLSMRSGWDITDDYLLFDCAPTGVSTNGGSHSHSDPMSIMVYSGGEDIIVDGGIVTYDDPLALYYQSAKAHNVIVFDGKYYYPSEIFHQPMHQKPVVSNWVTTKKFDYAGCYYTSPAGPVHNRKVFYVKDGYWIVSDLVTGTGTHALDMLMHPNKMDQSSAVFSLDGITAKTAAQTIPSGSRYTDITGSPFLDYSKSASLPAVYNTLIMPGPRMSLTRSGLTVKEGTTTLSADKAIGYRIDLKANVSSLPVVINAKGSFCRGWTMMFLRIDGNIVGTWEVNNSSYKAYEASAEVYSKKPKIDVVYYNDYDRKGNCSRTLYVDYVKIGDLKVEAENGTTNIYDTGYGSAAFDDLKLYSARQALSSNGALRINVTLPADVVYVQRNYSDYFLLSYKAPSSKLFGSVQFNGELAYVRETDGKISRVIMHNGTNLQYTQYRTYLTGTEGNYTVNVLADSRIDETVCYPGIAKVYVNNKQTHYTKEGICVNFTAHPDNDASFISQTVPSQVEAGKNYPVTIAFQNMGTNDWTYSIGYKLGSVNPENNTIWGFKRVNLSTTETIGLSITKTFRFNITAPKTPGQYKFQWRMLRENKEWFGETSTNVLIKVVTATTTTSTTTSTTTMNSTSTTTTTRITTTTTSTTTSSSTTSTSTTIPQECDLIGDYPPCDTVTLNEVIEGINKWANDQMTLSDVLQLINAWAQENIEPSDPPEVPLPEY